MKLKYYLRGIGVGVVLTAIIMGIVLGKPADSISDAEIIRRAKQLGMVEAESTLQDYSETAGSKSDTDSESTEVEDEKSDIASGEKVDKTGEEVSEEVNEGESSSDKSVSEVVEETQESSSYGESSESVAAEADVKLAIDDAGQASTTDSIAGENTTEAAQTSEVNKTQEGENNREGENVSEEGTAAEAVAVPAVEQTAEQDSASAAENVVADANENNTQVQEAAANETQTAQTGYIVVVLPGGSESDTCARILREAGVIEDGVAFNRYLVNSGLDRKIRSGTKQIPRGSSFEEVAAIITK